MLNDMMLKSFVVVIDKVMKENEKSSVVWKCFVVVVVFNSLVIGCMCVKG